MEQTEETNGNLRMEGIEVEENFKKTEEKLNETNRKMKETIKRSNNNKNRRNERM